MPRRHLKVVHKPPGYEAWKDETTIPRPRMGLILVILSSVAGVALCAGAGGAAYFMRGGGEQPLPTLVVIANTVTPLPSSATPERFNVQVIDQIEYTPTPEPSSTPVVTKSDPTDEPDLRATMSSLLAAQQDQAVAVATETVFCDGAPFQRYEFGSELIVSFEQKTSLRLLDKPRTAGSDPNIIRLLFDGHIVTIAGEPTCGAWEGSPVVYWPVRVANDPRAGYVGFGRDDDVWLERAQ